MAIPNIDTLYECGSTLSAAKAADYAKVRNHQIFIFIILPQSQHCTSGLQNVNKNENKESRRVSISLYEPIAEPAEEELGQ